MAEWPYLWMNVGDLKMNHMFGMGYKSPDCTVDTLKFQHGKSLIPETGSPDL